MTGEIQPQARIRQDPTQRNVNQATPPCPLPRFHLCGPACNAARKVYLQWDADGRAGAWTIRIDTPSDNHDFDLFGRDDQGSRWDDRDRSNDGDERITFTVQSCGHLYIRVMNYDCGAPTQLTLTIEPPNGG